MPSFTHKTTTIDYREPTLDDIIEIQAQLQHWATEWRATEACKRKEAWVKDNPGEPEPRDLYAGCPIEDKRAWNALVNVGVERVSEMIEAVTVDGEAVEWHGNPVWHLEAIRELVGEVLDGAR